MNTIGNWLYHFFGIAGSGPYYGFWSGAGSDIGEVPLLGAVWLAARHVNCSTKGCWRIGHPIDGGLRACHRHHPTHPRQSRNVPLTVLRDINAAHRRTH